VIAVTGGIATGKSQVCSNFQQLGCPVMSADSVSHELTSAGGEAVEDVRRLFGQESISLDGSVDRKQLGRLVFKDAALRKSLEEVIHGRVRSILRQAISNHRQNREGFPVLVVEVPLLFEAGFQDDYDLVVVVTCSKEQQLSRLTKRSGLSTAEAEDRINSQMPLSQKASMADVVIVNDGSPNELMAETRAVLEQICPVRG